jgi:hypothetical protein
MHTCGHPTKRTCGHPTKRCNALATRWYVVSPTLHFGDNETKHPFWSPQLCAGHEVHHQARQIIACSTFALAVLLSVGVSKEGEPAHKQRRDGAVCSQTPPPDGSSHAASYAACCGRRGAWSLMRICLRAPTLPDRRKQIRIPAQQLLQVLVRGPAAAESPLRPSVTSTTPFCLRSTHHSGFSWGLALRTHTLVC